MRSATQKTTVAKGVDFWLLRFFDFSVQPGKRYKYRVRLVLADPNYRSAAANAGTFGAGSQRSQGSPLC